MIVYIVLAVSLVFLIFVLIWVWRRRHMIVARGQFGGISVFHYFQNADRKRAIEEVEYMQEEKREDESGPG